MKTCTECKREKPAEQFSYRFKHKSIRHSACKDCSRKRIRKYYRQHSASERQRIKLRREQIAKWFSQLKLQLKKHCRICKENHPACLDFHHRDPKSKTRKISDMVLFGWGKERILKELRKCDVLCSNCHRKLHWKLRGRIIGNPRDFESR